MDSMHYVNSMYTLMYLQATCVTECFITHYSDMDAPQYLHYVILLALLNV